MRKTGPRSILTRARDSVNGLRLALADDRSVRDHLLATMLAVLLLAVRSPEPFMTVAALILLLLGLALELVNGALEDVLDRLHPEEHPAIGSAKDKASAAAFVVNVGAGLIVLAAVAF